MATREENIKKINEELEKLDDEQLEQVAGGIGVRDLIDFRKDSIDFRFNQTPNPANTQNTPANQLGTLIGV